MQSNVAGRLRTVLHSWPKMHNFFWLPKTKDFVFAINDRVTCSACLKNNKTDQELPV